MAARTRSRPWSRRGGNERIIGFGDPSPALDACHRKLVLHHDPSLLPAMTAGEQGRESLAELVELARSAGAEVAGTVYQVRESADPATLVGRGKLEEIRSEATAHQAPLIILDGNLSPVQQRNIEEATDRRVIDRTQLILDIFARHARSREGQLQVELAQLNYLL